MFKSSVWDCFHSFDVVLRSVFRRYAQFSDHSEKPLCNAHILSIEPGSLNNSALLQFSQDFHIVNFVSKSLIENFYENCREKTNNALNWLGFLKFLEKISANIPKAKESASHIHAGVKALDILLQRLGFHSMPVDTPQNMSFHAVHCSVCRAKIDHMNITFSHTSKSEVKVSHSTCMLFVV